jgi:hypothetical protein
VDKRGTGRADCGVDVEVARSDGSRVVGGALVDVSEGGMRVRNVAPAGALGHADRDAVRITSRDPTGSFDVVGRVRRVDVTTAMLGIELDGGDDEALARIVGSPIAGAPGGRIGRRSPGGGA